MSRWRWVLSVVYVEVGRRKQRGNLNRCRWPKSQGSTHTPSELSVRRRHLHPSSIIAANLQSLRSAILRVISRMSADLPIWATVCALDFTYIEHLGTESFAWASLLDGRAHFALLSDPLQLGCGIHRNMTSFVTPLKHFSHDYSRTSDRQAMHR